MPSKHTAMIILAAVVVTLILAPKLRSLPGVNKLPTI